MAELASKYDHKKVEESKNKKWIENKYFQEHDLSKEPFSIVIPPPNVTGRLHLGHAWDTALQDIIIRYKKLQGFDTLWMPGMDHAGIATQAKVEEKLRADGISRYDLGREKFIEEVWSWKEEYASHIREQWGKLGLGLDYAKERFTLDDGCNQAVLKVFVELYNKGLIYRKRRIINWDPFTKTALSNIEVEHKEVTGAEYYFRYYFEDDSTKYIEVMSTRPETIFGDVAIAVNPKDERYEQYVGKNVICPVSHNIIPIITDSYVDIEAGTGCVKITPAHDPNDFMVGERHNLEQRIIMDESAKLTGKYVNEEFQGLDRFDARKLFIKKSEEENSLVKIVEIKHNVGHSQRSGVVVEPILSLQWFVSMKKMADDVIKFQEQDDKVDFIPKRFENTFLNWMNNIEDWCISRQLWWGHRIPAWYHKDTKEVYVGLTPPDDIENYIQDEDVLDTWFSSGLWPFVTLGWPNDTMDFARYFPTNTLVTGYDIIFFWVARMMFTSLEFTNEKPFNDVLIHGLVRDAQGRKMSKSLGNGIDPMEVIDTYGADALRFFLATTSSPGQDLRYNEEKLIANVNFINKIWNASRFVQMNTEDIKDLNFDINNLTAADKWILTKLNETIKEVETNMDKYEFTNVGNALVNFIWNDYCSWYLELAKSDLDNIDSKKVLRYVLEANLKMLSPFMPFVCEELYTIIFKQETIVNQDYPKYHEEYNFNNEDIEYLMELITKFREVRLEKGVKKSEPFLFQSSFNFLPNQRYLQKIINAEQVDEVKVETIEVITLRKGLQVVLDLSMVKVKSNEELLKEYEAELNRLNKEIKRASGMLNNEAFLSKAPEAKINEEKTKLADYEAQLASVKEIIEKL